MIFYKKETEKNQVSGLSWNSYEFLPGSTPMPAPADDVDVCGVDVAGVIGVTAFIGVVALQIPHATLNSVVIV